MFPVFLDLTDRLAVVIGGGAVGQRKAAALLDGAARVRIVCLEPASVDLQSPRLEWRSEAYRPEHLEGAVLVFAAAVAEVNQRVLADARARGVWVNAADDPCAGDFYLPALVRRGRLVVAIGTGGAAPALARRLRDRLEQEVDEAYGYWVDALAELRSEIRTAVAEQSARRGLYEELSAWEWLDRFRHEDAATVREAMRSHVRALVGRISS